jgi:hypothetical protein
MLAHLGPIWTNPAASATTKYRSTYFRYRKTYKAQTKQSLAVFVPVVFPWLVVQGFNMF